MIGELKFRCQYEGFYSDKIALACFARGESVYSVAQPLTLIDQAKGTIIEPFARMDKSQAQVLMDDLWQCGLRPSEGSGSAGAMAATQKHLEDMRTLVFKRPTTTGEVKE